MVFATVSFCNSVYINRCLHLPDILGLPIWLTLFFVWCFEFSVWLRTDNKLVAAGCGFLFMIVGPLIFYSATGLWLGRLGGPWKIGYAIVGCWLWYLVEEHVNELGSDRFRETLSTLATDERYVGINIAVCAVGMLFVVAYGGGYV